jgi:hypothetical protein
VLEDELDLDEEAAGVDEAGAEVDWASAGPAIRAAAATTGIRYLNIIAVVSERKDWCVRCVRLGLPASQSARIMPGIPRDERDMTAT